MPEGSVSRRIDKSEPTEVSNLVDGGVGSQMKLEFLRDQRTTFDVVVFRAFSELTDIQVFSRSRDCVAMDEIQKENVFLGCSIMAYF